MVDAVVLAGGDGAVIDPACRFKGLLPIAGRPMVEWVADALLAAETIREVAVVVPSAENLGKWVDDVGKIVVSDGSFVDNVVAGLGAFRGERPVLLVTGDIPAITPEAIDDFVRSSLATGADVTYPLVRKEDVLTQFPGSKRTYIRLIDGPVTGGNMMLVNPVLLLANREIGGRIFATRKSPVAMAHIIGIRFVVKLVFGRLTVSEVEQKLGKLIGGTGAAVYTAYASVGADVDKREDVVVAEKALYERTRDRAVSKVE
ncbi:MAG: nucleotidyltransferase family protein [Clostridiales bacterium]|nr:nucleotidyltransferase family protein [Clostridiales bacterium]